MAHPGKWAVGAFMAAVLTVGTGTALADDSSTTADSATETTSEQSQARFDNTKEHTDQQRERHEEDRTRRGHRGRQGHEEDRGHKGHRGREGRPIRGDITVLTPKKTTKAIHFETGMVTQADEESLLLTAPDQTIVSINLNDDTKIFPEGTKASDLEGKPVRIVADSQESGVWEADSVFSRTKAPKNQKHQQN